MALLNPVYAFVVPFLLLVTVPLAVFAGITTTIAFSALILRVIAVYLDVALSLIPHYLGGRKTVAAYRPSSALEHAHLLNNTSHHHHYSSHHHYGHRRVDAGPGASASSLSSISSTASSPSSYRRRHLRRSSSALSAAGFAIPALADLDRLPLSPAPAPPPGPVSVSGLAPSIGPERDFEGVGGWRLAADDDEWTTINSRLELPDRQYHHARSSSSGATGSGSGHLRSPSGPTTPGEGGVLMMKGRRNASPSAKRSSTSPNSSRTRTPSGPRIAFAPKNHGDSYFPSLTSSPKSTKKMSPGGGGAGGGAVSDA